MAEKGPAGGGAEQEAMQAKFESLVNQIGPLMEKAQQGDIEAIKKLKKILAELKAILPPEVYMEQFGQLEQGIAQIEAQINSQMEG